MSKFTFIDLFAGIGGFHLGVTRNGGESIGFSEIDNNAIKHYCLNYNIEQDANFGDITKIDNLPKHDLLTAGVPCQSWSIAGRKRGFDDDRGQLWNDTIYLLNKSRPKAFIFENVKGLVDPRNKDAFSYILKRIKKAGYHATFLILNSYDYGVLQNRVRVYIVGFRNIKHLNKFVSPPHKVHNKKLHQVLYNIEKPKKSKNKIQSKDLFGDVIPRGRTKFQQTDELNDFFLFNDIRNGHTTIHSWDLIETSEEEKIICYALLKNRRKKLYGLLDGNPLSIKHFKSINPSINKRDINKLVKKEIFKIIDYKYEILNIENADLTDDERILLEQSQGHIFSLDQLKMAKELWKQKISFSKTLPGLIEKGVIKCIEQRYDFRYTKISSGLFGINRIYMPNSDIFSTLVASDTNDYVSEINIETDNVDVYKTQLIEQVYLKNKYRKITKEEACLLQGFPEDFILPETRSKWMKLIGNSVSVPVIESLTQQIVKTGVFD